MLFSSIRNNEFELKSVCEKINKQINLWTGTTNSIASNVSVYKSRRGEGRKGVDRKESQVFELFRTLKNFPVHRWWLFAKIARKTFAKIPAHENVYPPLPSPRFHGSGNCFVSIPRPGGGWFFFKESKELNRLKI